MMRLLIKKEKKENFNEEKFIEFIEKQGIKVKTTTNARGHLGFCSKNRIDVSKKVLKEQRIQVLAHEYAHKIHCEVEKDVLKTGGSIEKLFSTSNTETFTKELLRVTHFVDNNSLFVSYYKRKDEILEEIKHLELIIKNEHGDFKRSKIFKPAHVYFEKTKSDAKYFLKYDNVRLVKPFTRNEKLIKVKNIDTDFPHIPTYVKAYIKILSLQREQARLSRRKNKVEKYYLQSTELFARFIEGLFIDSLTVKNIAPSTYERFVFLLKSGYYGNLKELLYMAEVI